MSMRPVASMTHRRRADRIPNQLKVERAPYTQALGDIEPSLRDIRDKDLGSLEHRKAGGHQADGAGAVDDHEVTRFHRAILNAAHSASKGLHQAGRLMAHRVRQLEHVLRDDARRNANVLGVAAAIERKVIAHGKLPVLAPMTRPAWRRVVYSDAIALRKPHDASPTAAITPENPCPKG